VIVGGVWYLGPGDSSPEIRKIKAFMRKKFASYAGNLADTELYDQQMVVAVMEMQRRYGLPMNGLIGYSTKVRMGYLIVAPPPKPTLLTVNGAGVPWWIGPQADIARAVEDIYYWQPIGYDSKPFPMAPGVAQARGELGVQLDRHPGSWSMCIYSEGALAGSKFFKYDVLPPNGAYHHRLSDLKKVVAIGNPYRERDVVWDVDGNPARPGTQGISDDRLVGTPSYWKEIAHHGDIYAENTVDDAGEFKTSIYKLVQGQLTGGQDSLLSQIIELIGNPFGEGFAAAKAIISGIGFFGSGTREHVNYPIQKAIDYLRG
jgi:hypothetical protein